MKLRKNLKEKSDLSLDQVDSLLFELGNLTRSVQRVETRVEKTIKNAKERGKNETGEDMKRMKQIEKDVRLFISSNPQLFKVSKTKKMNHGEIGLRKSPGAVKYLTGWTKDKIIEALKKSRALAEKYLSIKYDLNKTALIAGFKDNTLTPVRAEKYGIGFSDADEPFVKVTIEELVDVKSEAA